MGGHGLHSFPEDRGRKEEPVYHPFEGRAKEWRGSLSQCMLASVAQEGGDSPGGSCLVGPWSSTSGRRVCPVQMRNQMPIGLGQGQGAFGFAQINVQLDDRVLLKVGCRSMVVLEATYDCLMSLGWT